jgi:predicted RNase H-like HicB family nuclease
MTRAVHVPYTVEQDEDGIWCAHAQLRPGVGANGEGDTAEAAVADLREALEGLVAPVAKIVRRPPVRSRCRQAHWRRSARSLNPCRLTRAALAEPRTMPSPLGGMRMCVTAAANPLGAARGARPARRGCLVPHGLRPRVRGLAGPMRPAVAANATPCRSESQLRRPPASLLAGPGVEGETLSAASRACPPLRWSAEAQHHSPAQG